MLVLITAGPVIVCVCLLLSVCALFIERTTPLAPTKPNTRLAIMRIKTNEVCMCVFITAGPSTKLFAWVCVFITAVPITKLFARGGGGMEDMCYERLRAEAGVN